MSGRHALTVTFGAGVLLGAVSALTILLEGLGGYARPACGWDIR